MNLSRQAMADTVLLLAQLRKELPVLLLMLGAVLGMRMVEMVIGASLATLHTAPPPADTAACSLLALGGSAAGRLVAVGDIHGEAVGLLEVLWRAKLLASDPGWESVRSSSEFARCADAGVDGCAQWAERVCRWGGRSGETLVQVGDIMDRGAHSLQALTNVRLLFVSKNAQGSAHIFACLRGVCLLFV